MAIDVGSRLPEATFYAMTADGAAPRTTAEVFAGRTVVLVGLPGAFTPTCHGNHLPGFIENAAMIKAKGVDAIAVTAVNDVFVMDAWAKQSGGAGIVDFLADGSGDFASAAGLSQDLGPRGMGLRSRRYCMVVRDGAVLSLAIEEPGPRVEASGADALLASLADTLAKAD